MLRKSNYTAKTIDIEALHKKFHTPQDKIHTEF